MQHYQGYISTKPLETCRLARRVLVDGAPTELQGSGLLPAHSCAPRFYYRETATGKTQWDHPVVKREKKPEIGKTVIPSAAIAQSF